MTLKEYRKSLKLTQEQFADKIHVSRITIARLEGNPSTMKVELLKRIMATFHLSLKEAWALLFENEKEDSK